MDVKNMSYHDSIESGTSHPAFVPAEALLQSADG